VILQPQCSGNACDSTAIGYDVQSNVAVSVMEDSMLIAEAPWAFLEIISSCAKEECKALLQRGSGGAISASRLTELLHTALEHAAGGLHETAVNETCVRSHSQQQLACQKHESS
jgi:hypothetical protein